MAGKACGGSKGSDATTVAGFKERICGVVKWAHGACREGKKGVVGELMWRWG